MDTAIPLFPGEHYHVFNRGINKARVFFDPDNFEYFVRLCEKYIAPSADIYAYCLIANHYHLLVRMREGRTVRPLPGHSDKQAQIWSQPFSNMFNAYTKAINTRYSRTGALFQRTFHRRRITTPSQLLYLVRYIHLNPQAHGVVEDFREWPYSSYCALRSSTRTWLDRNAVMEWFGNSVQFEEFHMASDGRNVELQVKDVDL
jgi:REP element-mobilizing transposase RayT